MRGVRFFPFPTAKKDPYMRQLWTQLVRRGDNWDGPKKHHRVCSRHFKDGEPSPQNPAPTIFPWTPAQTIFPKVDFRARDSKKLYGGKATLELPLPQVSFFFYHLSVLN